MNLLFFGQLRRLLSQLSAICAVVAWSSHAQAQLKSIDEIEAEVAARRSVEEATARVPFDARYQQIAGELEDLSERERELSLAAPSLQLSHEHATFSLNARF